MITARCRARRAAGCDSRRALLGVGALRQRAEQPVVKTAERSIAHHQYMVAVGSEIDNRLDHCCEVVVHSRRRTERRERLRNVPFNATRKAENTIRA